MSKQTTSPPDDSPPEIEVKLDASSVKEELTKTVKELLEQAKKNEQDKGQVPSPEDEKLARNTKIAEALRSGSLKEQWTVAIPVSTKQLAAHIRDHVFVSPVLAGKQGDTVNIPYVTDFDFSILASVGAAFSDSIATVYATTTATLKEAGAWTRINYADLEKIDANMIDLINNAFAQAAIRAEDKIIMDSILTLTLSSLAGEAGSKTAPSTAAFRASWIPDAITKLLQAGKAADPSEIVCWMTPAMYGALLSELAASQPAAFARPDIIQQGKITEYLGIKLVIGHQTNLHQNRTNASTGSRMLAFLGRYRRGVVLAPKRDLLIETEKDTVKRSQTMTGSHTLAAKVVDGKEFVRIWTGEAGVGAN